jgi:zinc protease
MKLGTMRRWVGVIVALVVATGAATTAGAQSSRTDLEKVIRRQLLPNGLEVIVVENHGMPIATIEFDVKNGAFTQTPEFAGLAHLYEHMFFKASRDYPQPDEFTDRASTLGAIWNATTQEERVNYYMTLPSDSLAAGIRLMGSTIRNPLFLAEELAREKEVVLGEYDRNESSPGFAWQNEMQRRLYPGNFSRKNTIGDREVLRTVTPEKLRAIQKRYYVPNNVALIVTGDVTPDSVFRYAREALADWPRGEDPFKADPIPAIPDLTGNSAVITEQPVSAVTVMVQWQGPSANKDRDATYAADVFSDALNTPGSRFQRRLVDSGLWQGVGVNYYTLANKGPISIGGQTTPENLRRALAVLLDEVEKLDDPGYFSAEELEAVKAQRATESAFGIERTSGLTHTVGFWWSVLDLDYFLGYVDNMAKQTPENLRAYAQQYIVGKPRVTGVLLAPQARRSLNLTDAELTRAGEVKP